MAAGSLRRRTNTMTVMLRVMSSIHIMIHMVLCQVKRTKKMLNMLFKIIMTRADHKRS